MDVSIATWVAKYHFSFWRPYTAIRGPDGGSVDDGRAEVRSSIRTVPIGVAPSRDGFDARHPTFSNHPPLHEPWARATSGRAPKRQRLSHVAVVVAPVAVGERPRLYFRSGMEDASKRLPTRYDHSAIYTSSKRWVDVLQTPPEGDAYYILAHDDDSAPHDEDDFPS